jgi:hypothetical protein
MLKESLSVFITLCIKDELKNFSTKEKLISLLPYSFLRKLETERDKQIRAIKPYAHAELREITFHPRTSALINKISSISRCQDPIFHQGRINDQP